MMRFGRPRNKKYGKYSDHCSKLTGARHQPYEGIRDLGGRYEDIRT